MELSDPTFVLDMHDDNFKKKTSVYDFKRTGEKDIFAVATNKGLFILHINSETLEIK